MGELSPAEHEAAAAELRFGVCCGELPWSMPASPHGLVANPDLWIDLMPEDSRFDKDTMIAVLPEERLVRLWASRHVEDRQLQAMSRVLERCGHRIQQTTGFKMSRNSTTSELFCVTGSKAATTRHKTGTNSNLPFALCGTQVGCEEPIPRYRILGSKTSADDRPTTPRKGTSGAAKLAKLLATPTLAIAGAAKAPEAAVV